MLVGFFIGAFIGTLFGENWMPLFLGCLGALLALINKWERELAPYNERRERRRQLKKRGEAKRRAAQRARASTLASSTTASQWQEDDDDGVHAMSDSGILTTSSLTSDDEPLWLINPATGLPMINNCLDTGGNAFGCSAGDDWMSDNFADSHIDDSMNSFDDSFSSFDD
ncbi:hypothetical protein [Alishewanella longhuensis]